jgi:hypothetical protein
MVPTASGGTGGAHAADAGDPPAEMGLILMSALSLTDLASMDDSVVDGLLSELAARGRCGVGPGKRYTANDQGGGRCVP